jgi:hypothetical protein
MERQTGRSAAVAEFGREGVLGQASLLADGSCPLAESLARGPGGFWRDGTSHKRNGGQVDAECRRRSLVTTTPQTTSNGTKWKKANKNAVVELFFETILHLRRLIKWRMNFLQSGLFFDTCL